MANSNEFYASESRKAVSEYRAQAVKYRDSSILRPCYVQLAWKNRRQAREYSLKAAGFRKSENISARG